ncbi:MAG TPA: hypothetical protein VN203_09330, partial [Candidatus Acidoferrum sp.]|nr:hypothetical protein [Candidatus Acidoferrum sp.]
TIIAAVSCTAADLATTEKVYLGYGEAMVRVGENYVAEAIGRALDKLPAKAGTGYVLSSLRLPLR